MLTITLQDLINAGPIWQTLTNIKKAPDKAFDIRTYWRAHIKPNTEIFAEEHRKLLETAGAVDDGTGKMEIPDNISEKKEKELTADFKLLCDKKIKIPTLNLTLKQLSMACKEPISEALLDGMEQFCKPEEKPPSKKNA